MTWLGMLPDMVTDNQIKIQSQLPEPSSTCWCLLAASFKLGLNLSLGTTLFVNTSVDTSSDSDLQDIIDILNYNKNKKRKFKPKIPATRNIKQRLHMITQSILNNLTVQPK